MAKFLTTKIRQNRHIQITSVLLAKTVTLGEMHLVQ